ncbi:unnamed protein product [Moneuplotes crassus]|uniref:Rab-GAP TBC domain-containing protein n=1 Tax=Euplotes crassus TaxID=5936 RepID=A0AAD1TZ07_EUPCR|nr:unnamed protein product [Moneuplotes crassus]
MIEQLRLRRKKISASSKVQKSHSGKLFKQIMKMPRNKIQIRLSSRDASRENAKGDDSNYVDDMDENIGVITPQNIGCKVFKSKDYRTGRLPFRLHTSKSNKSLNNAVISSFSSLYEQNLKVRKDEETKLCEPHKNKSFAIKETMEDHNSDSEESNCEDVEPAFKNFPETLQLNNPLSQNLMEKKFSETLQSTRLNQLYNTSDSSSPIKRKNTDSSRHNLVFGRKIVQKVSIIATSSHKDKVDTINQLPKFPEAKITRITRECYGRLLSDLGLSGSSSKGTLENSSLNVVIDRAKLLKVLSRCDTSQLPPSICHCTPGDHGYGCENSEEWVLKVIENEDSSLSSLSESDFDEFFDYKKVSEQYETCKVFAFGKVHSAVNYEANDKFLKDFMRDISRTFCSYNLFKHTNILAKFLNVILAIHQKYPEMEYIQGLNFIVASLCLHCNEPMAFWLFCNLSENLQLGYYYSNIDQILKMANDTILELKLKKSKTPMGKNTFKNNHLDSFAATWALSLMSHAVPLEYSEMLWEKLFDSGWEGFKIIIDAILQVLKPQLSKYCKFKRSGKKTILVCSNLAGMTKVLGKLNKPPKSKEYAIEYEVSEHSSECFQLWEAIKCKLLDD